MQGCPAVNRCRRWCRLLLPDRRYCCKSPHLLIQDQCQECCLTRTAAAEHRGCEAPCKLRRSLTCRVGHSSALYLCAHRKRAVRTPTHCSTTHHSDQWVRLNRAGGDPAGCTPGLGTSSQGCRGYAPSPAQDSVLISTI
uniref:Uncharacterized protein n=1 Tax=Rhipicephalus zambeziensis TaxID=60191 RepID=A0A224Y5S2_9ACAR